MKPILKSLTAILGLLVIGSLLSGCDKIGQTPSGGTDEEVKAAFDKLPIEERAKSIMSSPAPMDFKIQRIKDMYAKEGKVMPADLLKGGGLPPGRPPGQ